MEVEAWLDMDERIDGSSRWMTFDDEQPLLYTVMTVERLGERNVLYETVTVTGKCQDSES